MRARQMALAEVRDNLGRLWTMGGDGLAMLLLSNLVILVTGGISLALTLARVWRVARRTLALTTFEGVRLVPGVFLKDGRPNADFVKRLERAQGLSGEGAIVLLGGQTAASGPSEAAAARDWLVARGLAADRIRLETGSRNTLENLWAARGHFLDAGGRAVVITNRYHLARAGALADGLAIDHELCRV